MADSDDNLELNPNNVIVTTETPSGTSSDNSQTEEEVAIPRLAVEEDVDIAEAEADTPKLVVEEAVDIARLGSSDNLHEKIAYMCILRLCIFLQSASFI